MNRRRWLKALREKNGMSQAETASALNITPNYLSMIENGERQKKMSLELARKISTLFGVPIDEILKNESEV